MNVAHTIAARRAGSYGFDAPYAPAGMVLGGLAYLAGAISWGRQAPLLLGPIWLGLGALVSFAMAGSYIYTTRRGKFVVWSRLIAGLGLRGDECVLDMGCGRGLVLLEVARCLTTGRAVGIDLWRSGDQSGNRRQATLDNAVAEQVADRVDLHTADMTALPFADASFDVVTSSLAIHNIPAGADRAKAVDEAVRVLRPGGTLVIADFRHTRIYADRCRKLGLVGVARRSLGWRFWYGGPPWATYLVTATKSPAASG